MTENVRTAHTKPMSRRRAGALGTPDAPANLVKVFALFRGFNRFPGSRLAQVQVEPIDHSIAEINLIRVTPV